jgi:hypothetical protein
MHDDGAALQTLARRFEHFAAHDCTEDPLYVALCRLLAQRPAALTLLLAAEAAQRKPNLLLAALHERVLAGGAPALAPYYASAGGMRVPDPGLGAALDAALQDEHDALARLIATRSTQTNEIGRCAVLWPALAALATWHRRREIALLDFGCSAGLNLGVDRYGYDYGAVSLGGDSPSAPRIACRWIGGAPLPPPAASPRIVQRLGIDPAPVDLDDEAQRVWLQACLWPGDRERAARLAQAVALARAERWPVRREADCTAAIGPWLDALGADVQPVVFSSFVLMYFERDARQRQIAAMRTLVRERGIVWLSAEGPGLGLGDDAPPPLHGIDELADGEIANGALWWAVQRDGEHCLARTHPHGRWMQWFGIGSAATAPR